MMAETTRDRLLVTLARWTWLRVEAAAAAADWASLLFL